jgi:WD40 repeat protein
MALITNKRCTARQCSLLFLFFLVVSCHQPLSTGEGFQQANEGLFCAEFSHDGSMLFVASFSHGGSLWLTAENERLYNWNHTKGEYSAIHTAVFSQDDKFVASTEGKTLVLWNTASGEPIRHWESPSNILSLAIGQQYVLLGLDSRCDGLATDCDNLALLFNTVEGGVVGSLEHDARVSSVAISSDAEFALTGSHDGSVRVWSLDSGQEIRRWQHHKPVDLIVLSDDDRIALTTAYQGRVSIWDTHTGTESIRLYDVNPGITSARFNHDNSKLLLGTSREQVILWSVEAGEVLQTWAVPHDGPWHRSAVLSVGFDRNEQYLLATASNGFTYRFR